MKRDIAKILDTRNLKAVKLRFDVRAEQSWEPPPPKARIETKPVKVETWNPYQSWME